MNYRLSKAGPVEINYKVNEKLPKQVKYIIRPIHTSLITAIAQFNGNEYEGSGFTQREAKNEAARSLLKEIVIPYPLFKKDGSVFPVIFVSTYTTLRPP